MNEITRIHPLQYRSIFISDIHLGFRGSQARFVLDFLRASQCKQLYLVGDIIDFWAMKNGLHWPAEHNEVVREILAIARRGTEVIYIPGNHDDLLRGHLGTHFGNVVVRDEVVHTMADGRRFLVLHGDKYDSVVQHNAWLAHLGARAYDSLLAANSRLCRLRARFGMPYWSLAAFLKHKVKNAVNYIGKFEDAVAAEAREHDLDGMICGHIHHAEIREIGEVAYCNCGDWVESCTALTEHHDGTLELLRWTGAHPESLAVSEPAHEVLARAS